MTRVWVEPRPFDQGLRKNDAFTHSATLPTACQSGTQDFIGRPEAAPSEFFKDMLEKTRNDPNILNQVMAGD